MVVDEVLAVGDAEFQRKCLGKMGEVERSGRTVLFVSHNLDAIIRLCPRAIWLDEGSVRAIGPAAEVLDAYLASGQQRHGTASFADDGAVVALTSVSVLDAQGRPAVVLARHDPFTIEICFAVHDRVPALDLSAVVTNLRGLRMLDEAWSDRSSSRVVGPGTYTAQLEVPPVLNVGEYSLSVWIGSAYDDYVWADGPITFRLDGGTSNRDERLLQMSLPWSVRRERGLTSRSRVPQGCWLLTATALAGHVRRVVAGEEDDHVGHLPRLGGAAEGLAARSARRAARRCVTLARNGCIARLGATALTRTSYGAASIAAQRVRAITPALAAA